MDVAPPPTSHSQLVALAPEVVTPDTVALSGSVCLIGRSVQCDVVVRVSHVSRRHARIERRSDSFVLSDLESVNGTYVNGQRLLSPHRLRNDDQIGLGYPTALLRFVDPDATQVSAGVLRLDERSQSFYLGGVLLDLSPLQYMLLRHLYQHANEVCPRPSCALAIWGRPYDDDLDRGALDTAVSDLRRSMRRADPAADLIETRRGQGYLLRL
ncbi:MAG TPA: FHA domain-containing protein [Chloroflexaceae bacterium]|nr:FHA domain-containing protein [Chloroflexaceae bacterium]